MLLSEKIMSLRKRNGWSQEELAQQLGVSRQSVSKWESMASMPDIQKIMAMSELFGVSTDYLLKDELEELPATAIAVDYAASSGQVDSSDPAAASTVGSTTDSTDGGTAGESSTTDAVSTSKTATPKLSVSLDTATEYLDAIARTSRPTAGAITLFILGPALLVSLATYSEDALYFDPMRISPDAMGIAGVCIMMLFIAAGVGLLILQDMKLAKFKQFKEASLELQYGVEAAVRRRAESTESLRYMQQAAGVCLTILSAIPFLIASYYGTGLTFALGFFVAAILVSLGVYLLVYSGILRDGYRVLLQEGDFSHDEKSNKRDSRSAALKYKPIARAYFGAITLLYVGYSFITKDWKSSWIIWPVSALLYHIIISILNALKKR
ncbi:MAG: helix-turn-helix transcriptional regulator [Atopobium sp.]|nr:helix-turn-helix transcriptional regulator [Atopobium sp.]